MVPRITGPIRRMPVEMSDVELLRANTDRAIQITLPGPFTQYHALDEERRSEGSHPVDCGLLDLRCVRRHLTYYIT